MGNYVERAKAIIERVREHPDWKKSHHQVDFGRGPIRYYDDGKDFFTLRAEAVEITFSAERAYQVTFESGCSRSVEDIRLSEWLEGIEKLIPSVEDFAPLTIIIDGVKFVREVKTDGNG